MARNESTPLVWDGSPKHERMPSIISLLKFGNAVITNSGSTARDHLANERTYLAWIRTSLALLGAGLALLKWDAKSSWFFGYLVAVLGLVALMTSTHRYLRVMQLLEDGKFEPNVHGVLLIVLLAIVGFATAFWLHSTL